MPSFVISARPKVDRDERKPVRWYSFGGGFVVDKRSFTSKVFFSILDEIKNENFRIRCSVLMAFGCLGSG